MGNSDDEDNDEPGLEDVIKAGKKVGEQKIRPKGNGKQPDK